MAATDILESDTTSLPAAYYTSARQEIIMRIIQRDQAISLYLGAASLVTSLVASLYVFSDKNPDSLDQVMSAASYLLLMVPLLSYAVAMIISQHNTIIGAIEVYLATEFDASSGRMAASPHWDASDTFLEIIGYSIKTISRSHRVLIVAPATILIAVFGWYHGQRFIESNSSGNVQEYFLPATSALIAAYFTVGGYRIIGSSNKWRTQFAQRLKTTSRRLSNQKHRES